MAHVPLEPITCALTVFFSLRDANPVHLWMPCMGFRGPGKMGQNDQVPRVVKILVSGKQKNNLGGRKQRKMFREQGAKDLI